MASGNERLESVTHKNSKYGVCWDPSTGKVYIKYSGWTKADTRARDAAHAIRIAQSFLAGRLG